MAFPTITHTISPLASNLLPPAYAVCAGTMTALAAAADREVATALRLGAPIMLRTPRTEPGYVAAVVLGAIPAIAACWRALLGGSGLNVSLRAVFCHGSPMVDFTSNGSAIRCELADLLVVVDTLSASRHRARKACLVQAKMARAAGRVQLAGQSSVKQLGLYHRWPSFSFTDKDSYGTGSFLLNPNAAETPSWFGVIDRHLKNGAGSPPPVWTQHPPSPTPAVTTGGRTLGAFVTDAVFGPGAGRPVAIPAVSDWDRLVELLLQVTYAGLFRDTATLGPSPAGRGVTALAFRAAGVMQRITPKWTMGSGAPPVDGAADRESEPAPSGVSVLHVEVGPELG